MAAPQVAGAAALLMQRHPTWTVAEIKSALVQTGDPVLDERPEVSVPREGGGLVDLPRPTTRCSSRLRPASRSASSVRRRRQRVTSRSPTPAAAPATWTSTVPSCSRARGSSRVPPTVTVPGTLTVTATGGQSTGDVDAASSCSRAAPTSPHPVLGRASTPLLAGEPKITLTKPGIYTGTTLGAPSLISSYRYPTGGDAALPGPRGRLPRPRLGHGRELRRRSSSRATPYPHVVFDGDENHLAGFTGLPTRLNPYRKTFGATRRVAGGRAAGGGHVRHRLRHASAARRAVHVPLLGERHDAAEAAAASRRRARSSSRQPTPARASTRARSSRRSTGSSCVRTMPPDASRIAAAKGRTQARVQVSDYQETKNMEDVPPILPNTATLRATVRVR